MHWNGYKLKDSIGVCKDCIEREVGCHATCEKYINAKIAWDESRQKINEEKHKISSYESYHFDMVCKRKMDKEKKANKKGKR